MKKLMISLVFLFFIFPYLQGQIVSTSYNRLAPSFKKFGVIDCGAASTVLCYDHTDTTTFVWGATFRHVDGIKDLGPRKLNEVCGWANYGPKWNGSELNFDCAYNTNLNTSFGSNPLSPPYTVYMVYKLNSSISNYSGLWAVGGGTLVCQYMNSSSKGRFCYSSTFNYNTYMALDTWQVLTCVVNGSNSVFSINDHSVIANIPCSGSICSPGSFIVAGGGGGSQSMMYTKFVYLSSTADDDTRQQAVRNSLYAKFGITP